MQVSPINNTNFSGKLKKTPSLYSLIKVQYPVTNVIIKIKEMFRNLFIFLALHPYIRVI